MLAGSLLQGVGSRETQLGTGQRQGPMLTSSPALTPSHPNPRTGGTQHPSPTTTAHGTWWSMTGSTATCIKMGFGYGLSSHG